MDDREELSTVFITITEIRLLFYYRQWTFHRAEPSRTCCLSPCRASSAWRWCWRQRGSGCWSRSCWWRPQSWNMFTYFELLQTSTSFPTLREMIYMWMVKSPCFSLDLLPGLVSRIHQVLDVVVGGDGQLGQVFDVGSQQRVLSDTQVPLVFGVQQVTHTLTVDLHVTHLRREKWSCNIKKKKKTFISKCLNFHKFEEKSQILSRLNQIYVKTTRFKIYISFCLIKIYHQERLK